MVSQAELSLWESSEDARKPRAGSPRIAWRLFSPSFRLLVCAVTKVAGGFELRVTSGADVLTTYRAPRLEAVHHRAAEWRTQLERRGYVSAAMARVSDAAARACSTSSEARAALIGILECATILELEQPAAGRALRDRATQGLVALAMADGDLIRDIVAAARGLLQPNGKSDNSSDDLIRSCRCLLERVEATLATDARRE